MSELPVYVDAPCECPNAGWCNRHRMNKNNNQRQLCIESARYRKHWDYAAPHRTEKPPAGYEPPPEPTFKKLGLVELPDRPRPCCGKQQPQRVRNSPPPPPVPVVHYETEWLEFTPPPNWGVADPRWAVGVTTARRKTPPLLRSLTSLGNAGFTDVRVFAEPGSQVPKTGGVTIHDRNLGPFQNWRTALQTLRDEKPDAEFYFIAQDDVLYSKNLKAFLERDLWFDGKIGYVSPYRSSGKMVSRRWNPAEQYLDHRHPYRDRCRISNALWGALTYIMPKASVDILLADPNLKKRERMIDLAPHGVFGPFGRRCWYYNPSLAEHMDGIASSLGHGQGRGMNSGGSFKGEDFDCLKLLELPL
jgi:hypothetical protein